MMTTGCSMGAYHALNFFLQHPDVFSKVIALSGVYDARFFVGDYYNDDAIYQNSPVDYIWNQNDGWFIDRYRQAEIVLCTGLGAWEQDGLPSFYKLKEAFDKKQIPAWFAEWGHDVAHDWEWWRKQMPYFLGNLYLQKELPMNYLIISPYYPQNFQQFTIELANKGITVLGIGQESYEQLDEPLRNSLTEYFRVDNLENIDEVKRAVAFLFYKHGPIDRIESHNEYWLELDATLREQFNVFGAKPEDLKKTKYKSEMKKLFKKAGVPVVPGAVIKTEADVDQAVKEIGLPMIAKPDNGVEPAATFKLETEDDINHFKQEWDHSTLYFFEKFVTSSEIWTVDGLVDKDGKIVFSTTFDYDYTPLDLMIYKMDNSYYVLKDMDSKLRKYGEAIVKEFSMKERFFHIEFFRERDDYITIEYNNRPAGGFTSDVDNFAHSLDLYRGYAAIVAGEEFPASDFETQYCLATTRRANAHYVYSEEDLLAKYSQQFKVKKVMPAAFAELQGDYLYMLTTPSRQEMEQMIADFGQRQE